MRSKRDYMGIVGIIDDYARRNERGFFCLSAFMLTLTAIFFVWWALYMNYDGEAVRFNLPYANAIFDGIAPFTPCGDLRWEYPPLAYLLLLPPRIFTSDPTMYMILYTVEVLVFLLIGLRLLMLMASRTGSSQALIVLTYIVSVALLHRFIYDRFDIIVAVIALAAIYCFITDRYYGASVLIVLGLFTKLYPALLMPVFLALMLNRRQYREAMTQVAFCAVLCVALMAPFLIMAPDNAWNFISYHGDRGLQLESTAASFLLLGGVFGIADCNVVFSFGSWNLEGSTPDALATASSVIMVLGIVASIVLYLMKGRRCSESEHGYFLMIACSAVLASFVILNKVFSAQYVIWLMMVYLPLAMYLDQRRSRDLCISTIIMIALTALMVYLYDDLIYVLPTGIVVLVVRNILILIMLGFMWRSLVGKGPDAQATS